MTNAIAEQDDAEVVPGSRGMTWDWGFYKGNFSWFVHVEGDPEVIATVHGDGAEAADRARLIASAPKLLDVAMSAFYREVGITLAMATQDNGWVWPESAPQTVSLLAEKLRAAIAEALGA